MPVSTSAGAGAASARRAGPKSVKRKKVKAAPKAKAAAKAKPKPKTSSTISKSRTAAGKAKPQKRAATKSPESETAKVASGKKSKPATPRAADATLKVSAPLVAAAAAISKDMLDTGAAAAGKATTRRPPPRPISLVLKVLGTINGELTKLEEHTGKSSQDRERASRALSQMVTSLEKTVDMQRQIARDRSATSGPKDKEALRHAEHLRRDIAERLERLHRQRNAARRPESSERG